MVCNSCGATIEIHSEKCCYCGSSILAPKPKEANADESTQFAKLISTINPNIGYKSCLHSVKPKPNVNCNNGTKTKYILFLPIFVLVLIIIITLIKS